jgi:hypothetical protein
LFFPAFVVVARAAVFVGAEVEALVAGTAEDDFFFFFFFFADWEGGGERQTHHYLTKRRTHLLAFRLPSGFITLVVIFTIGLKLYTNNQLLKTQSKQSGLTRSNLDVLGATSVSGSSSPTSSCDSSAVFADPSC